MKLKGLPLKSEDANHSKARDRGAHNRVVKGFLSSRHRSRFSPAQMISVINAGLPIQELNLLQAGLGLPMEKLVPKLGMSKATFHRRKLQGRLGRAESDRVLRFARLLGKAIDLFETQENARHWLSTAQVGLVLA